MKKAASDRLVTVLPLHELFEGLQHPAVPVHSELQPARTVPDMLCHHATGNPGRIPVLIIKPAEHAVFLGLFIAEADQIHEFIAQVLVFQSNPDMNMKAAHAHFFELRDLTRNHLPRHQRIP